jgi:hypothetical protein
MEEENSEIEKTGDDLFEFAIDREDTKWLMAAWENDYLIKVISGI